MLTKKRTPILTAGIALALAASLGAPAAYAADVSEEVTTVTAAVDSTQSQDEFTQTMERLFTEAVILDAEGNLVSYDEAAAVEIVGPEEAAVLTSAVQRAGAPLPGSGGVALAASDQGFVDCMVENSVIGLVGGIASGAYAELIRERKWDELGEKLWPKVAKAGVAGGAVGVAASLAASAVQCTIFN